MKRALLLFFLIAIALSANAQVDFKPKFDGSVKAKLELSLNDGNYRFNVRNSRFGFTGNTSKQVNYRFQIDFNNEGKISVLDSYIGFTKGGFNFRLGQQQYMFSTDLGRGPTLLFTNRSFLAKYITSYNGTELSGGKSVDFVRTLGSRDLGAMASYKFSTDVPIKLYVGFFNGSGANNPEWGDTGNISTRFEMGSTNKGLRGSVSFYQGFTPTHSRVENISGVLTSTEFNQKLRMIGGEFAYTNGSLTLESEYACRYLGSNNEMMQAAFVQGWYQFKMPQTYIAKYLMPVFRWDIGSNIDYMNSKTKVSGAFDAQRLTAGLNIGLSNETDATVRTEFRISVEKYFVRDKPSDFSVNRLLHDKLSIEFVASF